MDSSAQGFFEGIRESVWLGGGCQAWSKGKLAEGSIGFANTESFWKLRPLSLIATHNYYNDGLLKNAGRGCQLENPRLDLFDVNERFRLPIHISVNC